MPQWTSLGTLERYQIPAAVPPDYRQLVLAVTAPGMSYLVLLFAHDRRDVVTSRPVRKALVNLPTGTAVLAIGANFTEEALSHLSKANAVVARLGNYYWTDASYASVR